MGNIKATIVLALLSLLGGLSSLYLLNTSLSLRAEVKGLGEALRACESKPRAVQEMCEASSVIVVEMITNEREVDEKVREVLAECPPSVVSDGISVELFEHVYCEIRGGSGCP